MVHFGKHILAEYWDCDRQILQSAERLQELLQSVTQSLGLTVLESFFRELPAGEVVGVLVLTESHMSIHAWPQQGYAAVDLYSVGKSVTENAHRSLSKGLRSKAQELVTVTRGRPTGMEFRTTSWRPVSGLCALSQDAA